MNPAINDPVGFPYLHGELDHGCVVVARSGPELIIRCRICGMRLQVEYLSACKGEGHENRVMMILRCPERRCWTTGMIKMQLRRLGTLSSRPNKIVATVVSTAPGWIAVRCPKHGGDTTITLKDFEEVDGSSGEMDLKILGSLACECVAEFLVPRTPGFRAGTHVHGGR